LLLAATLGLRIEGGNQGFSLWPFLNCSTFLSVTFSQKTQISEEDVKLSSREINGFIASKCFMTPGTAKICQELQARKILECKTAL
jgi:hypothetical protein